MGLLNAKISCQLGAIVFEKSLATEISLAPRLNNQMSRIPSVFKALNQQP
jgi:hypothetical protein